MSESLSTREERVTAALALRTAHKIKQKQKQEDRERQSHSIFVQRNSSDTANE